MDAPVYSGGWQYDPAVACGSSACLVVWTHGLWPSQTVRAARIGADARVLDPAGIPLTPGQASSPGVACDGTDFLAVWRSAGTEARAARVVASGVVLDTPPITVASGQSLQFEPRVAYGASEYLVVWNACTSSPGCWPSVIGARIVADGGVLDSALLDLTPDGGGMRPSVGYGGGQFVIAFEPPPDVYGARVLPNGAVPDPGGTLAISAPAGTVARWQERPEVTFDGTNFVLAASSGENVHGARLTPSGQVLDAQGIPLRQNPVSIAIPTFDIGLASSSTETLAIWDGDDLRTSGYDVMGKRLAADGGVLDQQLIAVSAEPFHQGSCKLAFDGIHYLAVWADQRSRRAGPAHLHFTIFGARVTSAGTVLESRGFPIASAANEERSPAISAAPGEHLIAWVDDRTGGNDIFAVRVPGEADGGPSLAFPVTDLAGAESHPSAASDGTNHLVAFVQERDGGFDLSAALVAPSTGLPDASLPDAAMPAPPAFLVAQGVEPLPPSLAHAGASYFAAWTIRSDAGLDVRGARIPDAGTILDPYGITISADPGDQSLPSLSADPMGFFAVWQDGRNLSTGSDIRAAHIDFAGKLAPSASVSVCSATGDQRVPKAAYDGANHLVVWEDQRSGDPDVYGARVSPGGIVLDPSGIPIATGSAIQRRPAVAFDQSAFLVIWEEEADGGGDLHGARVSPAGQLLDPKPFAVSTEAGAEGSVALAAGGAAVFIAYQRFDGSTDLRTTRLKMRTWGRPVTPPDAGSPDGGGDSGVADAGAPDAGRPDAGASDAGTADAADGSFDAGDVPVDTGDAGQPEVGKPGGCSCSSATGFALLALSVLPLATKRSARRK
ncbi:MAG: hypothetical protein HYZ28_01925 [Myxococcales bacterium]|nr:hypothetical protein [Myxococcales bacterium]